MILSSLRRMLNLLEDSFKKKLPLVLFAILMSGLIDVLGLAIVLPIVSITLNPDLVYSNKYYNYIYSLFDNIELNNFLLILYFSLLIIFLLRGFATYFISRFLAKFSFDIYENISLKMYRSYLAKDYFFFQENNTSKLIRDIKVTPLHFSRFIVLSLLTIFSEAIVLLFIIVSIVIYDYKLFFLLMVTIIPFISLFYRKVKGSIHEIGVKQNEYDAEMYYSAVCGVEGHLETKLLNKEEYFIGKYEKTLLKNNILNVRLFLLQQIPPKLIEFSAVLGIVMMMCYALFLSGNSLNVFAAISIYIGAAYRIMPSVNKMLSSFVLVKQYQYIFDIILPSQEKQISFDDRNADALIFNNNISLRDIKFSYTNSEYQLMIENLNIPKGQKVGFIGRSGSGKTTLMNLLLRFLKEQDGQILVDGKKLNDDNLKSWRKLIGYVKQDFFLLDLSIAENIAYGVEKENINIEKLKRCIDIASLTDVVGKMPNGFNTRIGEKGTLLSGGQKQRLAIARALYHDAEILIFDEATSALDNETEQEITQALANIKNSGLTIFVIAHRYSTLVNCDVIYEMENGRIVNSYTYHQLIKTKFVSEI